MNATLYKLRFQGGLHLGGGGFGEETTDSMLRSDTLFSAVCSAANLLYGKSAVEAFVQPDAVRVSSAFPYWGDELFFPKPLTLAPDDFGELSYADKKKAKKIRFINQADFETLLGGAIPKPAVAFEESVLQSCWRNKKTSGDEKLSLEREIPRVAIDRITHASTIFNVSEVIFDERSGFFFVALFQSADVQEKFEASLRCLGDEGIGANRSVGKGLFEVIESSPFSLEPPPDANAFVLLSLYTPTDNELAALDAERSVYDLLLRRGWVTAMGGMTLRRQAIRMFAEGSVLRFKDGVVPKGTLENVLPKSVSGLAFDIYRNAQAVALPIVIKETEK